jgi:uncharacterized membrane protein YqjE
MKISAMLAVGLTTAVLFVVTILAALDFSFSSVFILTVLGQGLLIWTVFKVLKDDYSTEKTFDDFYEDRPDLGRNAN